jgi:hypothetical protein
MNAANSKNIFEGKSKNARFFVSFWVLRHAFNKIFFEFAACIIKRGFKVFVFLLTPTSVFILRDFFSFSIEQTSLFYLFLINKHRL